MSTTLRSHGRIGTLAGLAASAALMLTACGSGNDAQSNAEQSSQSDANQQSSAAGATGTDGEWPRTFDNADGSTTEIPAQPERIASTSVTVTGTLLAIDAPVLASASAANGEFFAQWADVAQERDVANLWSAGSVDLEALIGQKPDLIVVSAAGADSLADQVKELQDIAPTIVVDYGGQTWQSLAAQLGEATGLEDQAAETVEEFDQLVADAKEKITVPEGKANIVSFNGAGENNPIALPGSAQAGILQELGFTIEEPNREWHTQPQAREDFVWATYENLSELTAETTFILSADNEKAQAFAQDPLLANLPSVKAGQVYGLGANSFRIDQFSATEIVESVLENFGK